MRIDMYENELRQIIEASEKNALTFFVGAGVSALSNAPDWKGLINAFCGELGREQKTDANDNFSSDEYLQIPQMYYYSIDEDDVKYIQFVKDQLHLSTIQPNGIHYEMLKLNPASFITTNYDTLLEDACIEQCQSYKVVSCDKRVPSIFGDKAILKIHGDFENNNIVLKEEDYLNYSDNFKLIETLVKSIFATNTVVFIGYSINDYNIKLILNWTKTLLGSDFRKPIFIRVGKSALKDEELQYHESRGLSVVECIKLVPGETEYLPLYQSVFDALKKLSIDNLDGITEDDAFDNLYIRLRPLDDMQALRISDVHRKLMPYVSFGADGSMYAHEKGELLLRKFSYISQMSEAEKKKLPKDIVDKYKCILSVLKKARINIYHEELYDLSDVPFADALCITFDYPQMRRYVARIYKSADSNYKKAFYLSRLKRYDEALILFSDLAREAYKERNYLLYYMSKSNCISLNTAINNLKVYNYYDQSTIEQYSPSESEVTSLFYRLPVEFRNRYDTFKDIYSSNMLYKYSYGAFVGGSKVQDAIEDRSLEYGLTSSGKAICIINEYLHFMQRNGIVADMFEEYKMAVRNLLSALVHKYSTCKKKVLRDTGFPFENCEAIPFDENDFYCFIECFKDKEIKRLFRRYRIETIEFNNMNLVEKAVNNILTYYEYMERRWNKSIEVLSLQIQLKACLALLECVNISQELVDRVCTFILQRKFREISFDDKLSFLYSQLYSKKMCSPITDKVVENTLISYLDRNIDRLKNGNGATTHDIPNRYSKLVYYLSSSERKHISRKLSDRVGQVIDLHLKAMYKEITWDYCDHITDTQRRRVIDWAKKEIDSGFSFSFFEMIVNYQGKIDNKILEGVKKFLWDRIHEASKQNSKTHEVFPDNNPYSELEQVGIWCFVGKLDRKDFEEFAGYSAFYDFFYEFRMFDFSRFDVAWIANYRLYDKLLLQVSKDEIVRDKIREVIAARLKIDKINEYDAQRLEDVLIEYFCYGSA